MSLTSIIIFCLIATSASVHARRGLKMASCPAKYCMAAQNNDPEKLRPSVNAGDSNLCNCVCDNEGNTILHLSGSTEGGCGVCADLLKNPLNCNFNVKDNGGNTPLHDAAALCQIPMTDKYLAFGSNPNAMNNAGDTPICKAVMNGVERCASIVQSIINASGNPCKKCSNGQFPFDIATNSVVKDNIANGGGSNC